MASLFTTATKKYSVLPPSRLPPLHPSHPSHPSHLQAMSYTEYLLIFDSLLLSSCHGHYLNYLTPTDFPCSSIPYFFFIRAHVSFSHFL